MFRSASIVLGRPAPSKAFVVAGLAVSLVVLAAGVAERRPVIAIGAAGCIALSTLVAGGVLDWRVPLYGLLVYLPFSGIPILATYPHTGPAVLLKDFVFIVPAYIGFGLEVLRGRIELRLGAVPGALLTMLALLVCLQALNPALPNRLVGAIGIKIWLFYIPLAFLAYHLVRDRRELRLVLGTISLAAVGPLLVGIAEAAVFRFGDPADVYRFYGDAAAVATGLFTELRLPSGSVLHRVPSTFSSWTQYFGFAFSMVALTYAWWRSGRGRGRAGYARLAVWVVSVVATFLSGARVAFLTVPLLVVGALVLEQLGRPRGRAAFRRVGLPLAGIGAAVVVLAVAAGGLFANVLWKARHELGFTFLHRFDQALHVTRFGLGTGIDTIASRYAAAPEQLFAAFGGVWYESWVVKVVLELGIPGLLLVVALVGYVLLRALQRHVALRDPALRAVSAALLAYLFVNVLLAVSKPYIDNDPINVLFPFVAGLLVRIAALDRTSAESGSP